MEDLLSVVSAISGQKEKIQALLNGFQTVQKFFGVDEESNRNAGIESFMQRVDKHLEELEKKIDEIGIAIVLQGYVDNERTFRSAISDCKRYANDDTYKAEENRDDIIKNAVIHYLRGICGKLLYAGDILSSVTEKYQVFRFNAIILKLIYYLFKLYNITAMRL